MKIAMGNLGMSGDFFEKVLNTLTLSFLYFFINLLAFAVSLCYYTFYHEKSIIISVIMYCIYCIS